MEKTILERTLVINEYNINQYKRLSNQNIEEIPEEHRIAYRMAIDSLKSKQCNEPYEKLISDILHLVNLDIKHSWDAIDNVENIREVYEYKPSSKTNSPAATINDDSIAKIEKCENLSKEGKKGWLILAGIDKKQFNFKVIYKFPLEIYNDDRKNYLQSMMEKNKNTNKTTQTRILYPVNVSKSIKLCKEFNLHYYVWKNK
jgi:hypothetical protein